MTAPLDRAVAAVATGAVVLYPTDTLYGLGASATDRAAVARVTALKDRPGGMPISIAVSSVMELDRWCTLDDPARAYARRHLPGPVTLLVPASAEGRRRLAPAVLGHDGTLGVRVPDHPVARELARRAGPITATSANRHGAPPAASIASARRTFGRGIAVYVAAGPSPSGRPSALADLRAGRLRLVERR